MVEWQGNIIHRLPNAPHQNNFISAFFHHQFLFVMIFPYICISLTIILIYFEKSDFYESGFMNEKTWSMKVGVSYNLFLSDSSAGYLRSTEPARLFILVGKHRLLFLRLYMIKVSV